MPTIVHISKNLTIIISYILETDINNMKLTQMPGRKCQSQILYRIKI